MIPPSVDLLFIGDKEKKFFKTFHQLPNINVFNNLGLKECANHCEDETEWAQCYKTFETLIQDCL